jgi:hypothetical protein
MSPVWKVIGCIFIICGLLAMVPGSEITAEDIGQLIAYLGIAGILINGWYKKGHKTEEKENDKP